jgi:hypothetical protein
VRENQTKHKQVRSIGVVEEEEETRGGRRTLTHHRRGVHEKRKRVVTYLSFGVWI